MYDYVGGEQIKCFPVPIFNPSYQEESQQEVFPNPEVIQRSGGMLRSFEREDELPLHTLYYRYPKDFMVLDVRQKDPDVWIFKNGTFHEFTFLEALTEDEFLTPVFDYKGEELQVTSKEDIQHVQVALENIKNQLSELEDVYFPNGYSRTASEEPELFDQQFDLFIKEQRRILQAFSEQWYVQSYKDEKHFGQLLDAFLTVKDNRYDVNLMTSGVDVEANYQLCKQYIQDLLLHKPNLVEEYRIWLQNDALLQGIDFESLLQEIKQ